MTVVLWDLIDACLTIYTWSYRRMQDNEVRYGVFDGKPSADRAVFYVICGKWIWYSAGGIASFWTRYHGASQYHYFNSECRCLIPKTLVIIAFERGVRPCLIEIATRCASHEENRNGNAHAYAKQSNPSIEMQFDQGIEIKNKCRLA